MSESFDTNNLRVGDVLLYRSRSWISWAIRTIDHSEVSHAALYLGDDRIAEALMKPGLTVQDRATSFKDCDWIEVRRIRDTALDMKPVTCIADKYLADGERYAYEQILLLGIICLTRDLDFGNPMLRSIAQRTMAAADAVLQSLSRDGKQPMICSEFVFRCYDEAEPASANPYTLEILSQASRQPQRGFSWFRQRLGMPAATPAVHPQSLLARVQKHPETMEAAPAAAPPSLQVVRDELEQLISQYAAGQEGRSVALAAARTPDIGMEELEATAARFARNLAETLPETDVHGRPSAPMAAAPTPAARIQAVIADFVTPGDLDKSPSLTTLGKIVP